MSTFDSKCNIEQLPLYLFFTEEGIRKADMQVKKA